GTFSASEVVQLSALQAEPLPSASRLHSAGGIQAFSTSVACFNKVFHKRTQNPVSKSLTITYLNPGDRLSREPADLSAYPLIAQLAAQGWFYVVTQEFQSLRG